MPFFEYSQNNSGGFFEVDEDVSYNVYIEADSAEEANRKAEEVGIYFDGCEKGLDCECCGDRWYEAWDNEKGTDTPTLYGVPLDEAIKRLYRKEAIVYYKDGTKKKFVFKEEKE